MRLRPLDLLVIAASAAAIVIASLSVYTGGGELEVVVSAPGGEWIYPLGEDRAIEVAGEIGTTYVHIEGGAALIVDSPCPTKTCVASGAISAANQWLACLPNRVFVRIEGRAAGGEVDAAVY